jgi:hypothetical protein
VESFQAIDIIRAATWSNGETPLSRLEHETPMFLWLPTCSGSFPSLGDMSDADMSDCAATVKLNP